MTSQTYAEYIPHFSDVLDGALPTFDQVNHAAGPTICSGFDLEIFTSGGAVKPIAHSDTDASLAARLFTLTGTPVRPCGPLMPNLMRKFHKSGRQRYAT